MLPPTLNLPNRPFSFSRSVISAPKAFFWSTPVILALAIFIVLSQGPGLLRDYQISQSPLPLDDGDIDNGRCTTRKFVFTDCEAQLRYSYQGQSYSSHVEVMFVDFHMGDYETGIVIASDHPELATMSLGLDKLWNRIITFSTLCVLLLGSSLAMLFLGLRIWRVKGQLGHPALLTPIPVEISSVQNKKGRLFITYSDKIADGKTKRTAYTHMREGEEPIIIGENGGKPVAMAVRHGSTALPVLLDRQLRRIDLTDQERTAALAPLASLVGNANSSDLAPPPAVKSGSLWGGIKTFLGLMLLLVVGITGFWLWYVLASPTQFQKPGMDINNAMPQPLNEWGCAQLKKRFGDGPAPYGCTASDFRSWKQ
ncbi:hypothetical protein [Rhizobium oryzicola]|uniref:DUF3592 domain-containing protein n=1 Tax=Rhizobium oryzicola TaxID=1232668 RepID=A0ABT8T189_9HYPH|nr:hypothetical protein [Rhizobium oryzicola]MDO1584411.1 hypothetical protein [Rhizobium oryzicola]